MNESRVLELETSHLGEHAPLGLSLAPASCLRVQTSCREGPRISLLELSMKDATWVRDTPAGLQNPGCCYLLRLPTAILEVGGSASYAHFTGDGGGTKEGSNLGLQTQGFAHLHSQGSGG